VFCFLEETDRCQKTAYESGLHVTHDLLGISFLLNSFPQAMHNLPKVSLIASRACTGFFSISKTPHALDTFSVRPSIPYRTL
jgi:hypothetical protein